MTSPIEVDRKLRQLDNDVSSIYQMLSAIQGTQTRQGNRLQEHSEKLDSLETKMDALDTKVGSVDAKVGSVDAKLDTVLAILQGR